MEKADKKETINNVLIILKKAISENPDEVIKIKKAIKTLTLLKEKIKETEINQATIK